MIRKSILMFALMLFSHPAFAAETRVAVLEFGVSDEAVSEAEAGYITELVRGSGSDIKLMPTDDRRQTRMSHPPSRARPGIPS